MSRRLTIFAAIALLLSAAGVEKVDAKGGHFSLHGPWPSKSGENNAAVVGTIAGYEAKSFFTPLGGQHQRSHRL